jgi:hypothetical protein
VLFMSDAMRLLKDVVRRNANGGGDLWQDIYSAMCEVASSRLTPEVESLLLEVVRFEGRIRLAPRSDLPSSMSPEDMLKSLSLQALAKRAGRVWLPTMRRVRATTHSPALASVLSALIRKVGNDPRDGHGVEMIPDLPKANSPAEQLGSRAIRYDGTSTAWVDDAVRRREPERAGI